MVLYFLFVKCFLKPLAKLFIMEGEKIGHCWKFLDKSAQITRHVDSILNYFFNM